MTFAEKMKDMIDKGVDASRDLAKKAGEKAVFGGLFGESAILPVRNPGLSGRFVRFAGRIPAPIHSLHN